MNYSKTQISFTVIIALTVASCNNLSNEVENKLNELKTKTESLDSVVNREVNKVLMLDSLITTESEKIKKLDSLINKNSSKFDSALQKKTKIFEQLTQ